LPQTATMSNDSIVKFRPFDKVETNWTCSICFDIVEGTKFRSTLLPKPATLLQKKRQLCRSNIRHCRIVQLVAFDNVASTLLLVWTGLYISYKNVDRIANMLHKLYHVGPSTLLSGKIHASVGQAICKPCIRYRCHEAYSILQNQWERDERRRLPARSSLNVNIQRPDRTYREGADIVVVVVVVVLSSSSSLEKILAVDRPN